MSIVAINHVQLSYPAGEEAEIRRFYTGLVGLTEIAQPVGSTLRFQAGGHRLDLAPTENWLPPPASAHLAFEVKDLPALRERLRAAEVPLDEQRPLPGHRRFYVRDPAGNPLEFLEPQPAGGAV